MTICRAVWLQVSQVKILQHIQKLDNDARTARRVAQAAICQEVLFPQHLDFRTISGQVFISKDAPCLDISDAIA